MRAKLKDEQPWLPEERVNRVIIAGCSAAATKPAGRGSKRGEAPLCKDTVDKDGDVCADLASVKKDPFLSHSSVCCSIPPQWMLSEH